MPRRQRQHRNRMVPRLWYGGNEEAIFRALQNDPSALEYLDNRRSSKSEVSSVAPIDPENISPDLVQRLIQGVNPTIAVAGAPPPPTGWPDAFMSYPLSNPITLDGVSNQTIEYLSFEDDLYPARPITLLNCTSITLRRIDSRNCSMGLVYAYNCTDITIEYCRTENIVGPHERPGGENRANFYQFNNVDGFDCSYLLGRYGDTEDAFSHFNSRNGVLHDFMWEGAIVTNRPTSNGAASRVWESHSGTGVIMGDGGGHSVTVRDGSVLNPGQVGIAIAGGNNCTFNNVVVVSEGSSPVYPENVGAYVWNQYAPSCYGHAVTNCRVRLNNGNNWWNGSNCGSINLTGSVFGDASLVAANYRVTF